MGVSGGTPQAIQSPQPGNTTLYSPYGQSPVGDQQPQPSQPSTPAPATSFPGYTSPFGASIPPSGPASQPASSIQPGATNNGTGNSIGVVNGKNVIVPPGYTLNNDGSISKGGVQAPSLGGPGQPATTPSTGKPQSYYSPGNLGTGWANPNITSATDITQAVQMGVGFGYQGQALINWLNQTYPNLAQQGGLTVYPDKNNIVAFADPTSGQAYYVDWTSGKGSLVPNTDTGGGGGAAGAAGGTSGGVQNGGFVQAVPPFDVLNSGPTGGQYTQLFNQLMGRANESLDINGSDPIIANQVNAYKGQAEQAARQYENQLAESEGPNANIGAETRIAETGVGQQTGAMQAALIQNELNARRQEIQNALTQMGGMLTAEQQLQLQQELGYLNSNLQQQALNSGNSQFAANYGLNAALAANTINNQQLSGV